MFLRNNYIGQISLDIDSINKRLDSTSLYFSLVIVIFLNPHTHLKNLHCPPSPVLYKYIKNTATRRQRDGKKSRPQADTRYSLKKDTVYRVLSVFGLYRPLFFSRARAYIIIL